MTDAIDTLLDRLTDPCEHDVSRILSGQRTEAVFHRPCARTLIEEFRDADCEPLLPGGGTLQFVVAIPMKTHPDIEAAVVEAADCLRNSPSIAIDEPHGILNTLARAVLEVAQIRACVRCSELQHRCEQFPCAGERIRALMPAEKE